MTPNEHESFILKFKIAGDAYFAATSPIVHCCLQAWQANNQARVFAGPHPRKVAIHLYSLLIFHHLDLKLRETDNSYVLYTPQHAILEMNHPLRNFQGAGMPIRSIENSMIIV